MSLYSASSAAYLADWDRSSLASNDWALMSAFTEGMLSSGQGRVIDGDEFAYPLHDTTKFRERRDIFDQTQAFIAPFVPDAADMQLAQPVFMDLTLGVDRFDYGYPTEYGPSWFEHNVYQALVGTDEYVWIYGEHVDWWRDWIPAGALESLTSAQSLFHAGEPLGFDMVASGATGGLPARFVSDPPVSIAWVDGGAVTSTTLLATTESATRVTFYDGSTTLATDTRAPYKFDTSGLVGGDHAFAARAFTSDGGHTTSNILNE
jgi:hypothetical protein